jgi:nucleoid-associated protein YgaU
MKRYSSTRRKIDKSGMRVYSTTYYPEIPIGNSDTFIFTKEGDRLDNLAYTHYGDNTLWWVIAKANGLRGKIALKPATPLRIPGNVISIIEKFRQINSTS